MNADDIAFEQLMGTIKMAEKKPAKNLIPRLHSKHVAVPKKKTTIPRPPAKKTVSVPKKTSSAPKTVIIKISAPAPAHKRAVAKPKKAHPATKKKSLSSSSSTTRKVKATPSKKGPGKSAQKKKH